MDSLRRPKAPACAGMTSRDVITAVFVCVCTCCDGVALRHALDDSRFFHLRIQFYAAHANRNRCKPPLERGLGGVSTAHAPASLLNQSCKTNTPHYISLFDVNSKYIDSWTLDSTPTNLSTVNPSHCSAERAARLSTHPEEVRLPVTSAFHYSTNKKMARQVNLSGHLKAWLM